MSSKKRGRKETNLGTYIQDSEKKIRDWEKMVNTGKNKNGKKLSKHEKENIVNKISALRARVDKKAEYNTLQRQSRQL